MATINLGAIKFNWKGTYNNSTAYAVDDVVSSGGNSYVCILASTGNAVSNGTYWNLMAQAGTNGTDLSTTLTTQGDILYRDGSGLQRLAKGTANQELRINSGATAPEWHTPAVADLTNLSATNLTSGTIPNARYGTPTFSGANLTNLPSGASKYGQVIYVASRTSVSSVTSVGSFADFGSSPTVSITPTATSSKVLVEFNFQVSGGGSGSGFDLALCDGSNNVLATSGIYGSASIGTTMRALHTANTTSAVTYKLRGKVNSSGGHHLYLYAQPSNPALEIYMTATEILA